MACLAALINKQMFESEIGSIAHHSSFRELTNDHKSNSIYSGNNHNRTTNNSNNNK